MKNYAKLIALVLVILLFLPTFMIKANEKENGMEIKMKEYFNHFSLALGIDQNVKVKIDMDKETEKQFEAMGMDVDQIFKMMGIDDFEAEGKFSLFASLGILATLAGAGYLLFFDDGSDKSTYIVMGIYGLVLFTLFLIPSIGNDFEILGSALDSDEDVTQASLFYFLSVIGSLGIIGIYAKEKFMPNK